jgi:hypothetical protein
LIRYINNNTQNKTTSQYIRSIRNPQKRENLTENGFVEEWDILPRRLLKPEQILFPLGETYAHSPLKEKDIEHEKGI